MSTAGKVLTVVVALFLIGWIFLFAQVAQLNTNWGKEIERLDGQIATLSEGIAETERTVAARLGAATRDQEQRDNALAVLRARLSDVEAVQSMLEESLARVQLQNERLQASLAGATRALETRVREVAQTEQSLAETRTRVGQLQEAVTERLDRLAGLREEFISTRTQNTELLQTLRGGQSAPGAARPDARTRPASFAR